MDIYAEYQAIMEAYKEKIVSPLAAKSEQRAFPRLKIKTRDLWVNHSPEFALEDISASGIALRSNEPMDPGLVLNISIGTSLNVEATVVGSRMLHAPDMYTDGEFLITCQFVEDLTGMKMVVEAVNHQA